MSWRDLIENKVEEEASYQYLTGLIGGHRPSTYSVSPKVWNAAFHEFGLPAAYLPFDVAGEGLEEFVEGLRNDKRLRGFNITIPYKKRIIDLLDRTESFAAKVEAVNTVVMKGDELVGFNTDGEGLVAAVEEQFGDIGGKRILQLGAGEAGNAIAYTLAQRGARLRLVNRTLAKAIALSDLINYRLHPKSLVVAGGEEKISDWSPWAEVIINTSTKGFDKLGGVSALWSTDQDNGQRSVEIARAVPKSTIFIDIIFSPSETVMLRQARESGHQTQNGLGMLIHQAALSFEKIFAEEVRKKAIDRSRIVHAMRGAL